MYESLKRENVFAYTGVWQRKGQIYTLWVCVGIFVYTHVYVLLKRVCFVGVICMFVFIYDAEYESEYLLFIIRFEQQVVQW